MLSFLLKKGLYFQKLYVCNYKIYKTPIVFFLKIYSLYQYDFEALNPVEIFKLNNLMYFNFSVLEFFDKNIVKFIF